MVLLSIFSEARAQTVNIPDPKLRRKVESALDKKRGETITQAEMRAESFKYLWAFNLNISDLTGLEYATNLEIVYLHENSISDLTPLSSLTSLKYIYLSHNQISDISPISNISAINTLDLSYNNLTSLDDLPDLSVADALYFQYNQITNIKALVDHTEFTGESSPGNSRSVDLEGNRLDEISINTYLRTIRDRKIGVNFPLEFMKKISGDNQTLPINTKTQPFVVEVCDINDNPLSGRRVRFLYSGYGQLVNGKPKEGWGYEMFTGTDTDGRASATLITGVTPGNYTLHFRTSGSNQKFFRITVEEPPPQQQETTPQQQQETTPQQQQEPGLQQEEELPPQQAVNPNPQLVPVPEKNYTIIPFDYEKEGVGKIVFSELMLAHLGKYPQWIELYNTTDQDIDMNGWKIVGRYLDDANAINLLASHVISKSFTIYSKETVLIVNFATPNSRDRVSSGLADKAYALGTDLKNFWNYEGVVLELQDAEGNPIDRIGNLNVADEIVWEIPTVVRNKRISLIRRLRYFRSQEYNFTFGVKEFGWFPAEKVERLIKNRCKYYYGRYTDIGSPGYRTEDGETLPVTLSSFRAQLNKNGQIIISWITESEIDNAGFNILRSQSKQGPFVKVNSKLIQGAGTTGERNTYSWTDTTAKPKFIYFYRIEDVSFAGVRQQSATVRLKGHVSADRKFTLSWGALKTQE